MAKSAEKSKNNSKLILGFQFDTVKHMIKRAFAEKAIEDNPLLKAVSNVSGYGYVLGGAAAVLGFIGLFVVPSAGLLTGLALYGGSAVAAAGVVGSMFCHVVSGICANREIKKDFEKGIILKETRKALKHQINTIEKNVEQELYKDVQQAKYDLAMNKKLLALTQSDIRRAFNVPARNAAGPEIELVAAKVYTGPQPVKLG